MAKRVSFWATKKIPKKVKISFINQYGERITFKATKRISVPVKITFYKRRRKKW